MLKILCKIFDHNWNYYVSSIDNPSRQFRCCPNCGKMQEYRRLPYTPNSSNRWFSDKEWISLTQRTKKGGKEFEAQIVISEKPKNDFEKWKNENTIMETKSWGTVLFRIKGDSEGFTEEQLKDFYFNTFYEKDTKV